MNGPANYMKTKLFIGFCLLVLCFPSAVFAAEIFFDTNVKSIAQGEEFLVHVRIDTEGDAVNAIAGTLNFPSNLFSIRSVSDGNSVLNFWIEKPESSSVQAGTLRFSGMTPGGFKGGEVLLFSMIVKAEHFGSGSFSMTDVQTLRNDGKGSSVNTAITPLSMDISSSFGSSTAHFSLVQDNVPPEDFNPLIAHDATLFDGKYFLVFSTQDKGSGISSYAVREGRWSHYKNAESPYLLQNQSLRKKIFVKAIDNEGNEKVASVDPRGWIVRYLFLGIFGIVIVGIAIMVYSLWRKKIS